MIIKRILFIFTLLIATTTFADQSGFGKFSITPVSHSNTSKIKQFDKFELGVEIPFYLKIPILRSMKGDEGYGALNPFLAWDIRVYAEFENKVTQEKKTVEGFYYQDYEVSEDKSKWVWKDTDHPFRIRFAPPKTGEWEVTAYLKVKYMDSIVTSNTMGFNVIESNHKGLVTIAENKKNFELDGKIITPVGINLPWPNDANSWFPKKNGPKRVTPKEYQDYIKSINVYHETGGEYFRMLLTPSANDIEFEKPGHYYNRLDYAWAMDEVFQTIEKNDMYVNFNLLMHTWMQIHGSYYMFKYDWDTDDCYGYENGYKKKWDLEKPHKLFLHTEAMNYMKQRYRYIIARWGYSPNIYTLELLSETGHLNEDNEVTMQNINGQEHCHRYKGVKTRPYFRDSTLVKAQYQFNKSIANYIKDSLQHREHVLAVSYLGISYFSNDMVQKYDKSFALENIDAIGLTVYSNSAAKNERFHGFVEKVHKDFSKPLFFSESGPSDNLAGCDKNAGYEVDSWVPLFSGIAGYLIWSGESLREDLSDYHGPVVWKYVVNANDFYNKSLSIDTILNGNWKQSQNERRKWGKNVKSAVAYGLISGNKKNAFGMVYNRTFNAHTQFDSTYSTKHCPEVFDACDCDDNPIAKKEVHHYHQPNFLNYELDLDDKHLGKYLKIKGLKGWKNYQIRWFDNQGNPISQYEKVTTNIAGQLKLKHEKKLIVSEEEKTPFIIFKLEEL